MIDRHSFGLDEQRPEALKRLQEKNRRTARTNVTDICDPDSFIEYGALAVAAQRQRRSLEELIEINILIIPLLLPPFCSPSI